MQVVHKPTFDERFFLCYLDVLYEFSVASKVFLFNLEFVSLFALCS